MFILKYKCIYINRSDYYLNTYVKIKIFICILLLEKIFFSENFKCQVSILDKLLVSKFEIMQ